MKDWRKKRGPNISQVLNFRVYQDAGYGNLKNYREKEWLISCSTRVARESHGSWREEWSRRCSKYWFGKTFRYREKVYPAAQFQRCADGSTEGIFFFFLSVCCKKMFFFSVGDPTLFWLVLSLIWENKSLSSLQRTSLFGWRSSFCFSSELHNFGVKYSLQWSEEVSGNIYFTYDPLLQLKCHLAPLGLILHVLYPDLALLDETKFHIWQWKEDAVLAEYVWLRISFLVRFMFSFWSSQGWFLNNKPNVNVRRTMC